MPPTPTRRSAPAAALALLLASGLVGCGDGRAVHETVAPVVMTDDGVRRGPERGAEPVEPPGPTRAGNLRSETETRQAGPTPTGDDPEAPPPDPPSPPPPPVPADDDGDDANEADDNNDDDAGDDSGDDEGDDDD